MRIHALINYSMANLGTIEEWTKEKGFQITTTKVYETTKFPSADEFDLLIILGGTMGAYEEEDNPWLRQEKKFISSVIKQNKAVLGICLGAQLIAETIGGKVYPHVHEEIGWWDVHFSENVKNYDLFEGLSEQLSLFQYHGDTFDLPTDAVWLAASEASKNQAFIYKDNVLGLQFHPEFSKAQLENIVSKHGEDITPGPYTQMPKEFLTKTNNFAQAKEFLFTLLDNFSKKILEN